MSTETERNISVLYMHVNIKTFKMAFVSHSPKIYEKNIYGGQSVVWISGASSLNKKGVGGRYDIVK